LGPSPVGLTTIFYCLRFETSLFVSSYNLQGYGWGIRLHFHTWCSFILSICRLSVYHFVVDQWGNTAPSSSSTHVSICVMDWCFMLPRNGCLCDISLIPRFLLLGVISQYKEGCAIVCLVVSLFHIHVVIKFGTMVKDFRHPKTTKFLV
jgi:hypothetical protein